MKTVEEFKYYKEPFDVNLPAPLPMLIKPVGDIEQVNKEYELRVLEWGERRKTMKITNKTEVAERQAIIVFTYGKDGRLFINHEARKISDGELISAVEVFKYHILKKITASQEVEKTE